MPFLWLNEHKPQLKVIVILRWTDLFAWLLHRKSGETVVDAKMLLLCVFLCVSLFNALFIHFPSLEFLDFGNAPWANKSFMCTQDYSPLYLNSSHQKLILIFRYINFQVISSLRSRTRSVYWLSDIHKICRLFVPQHMTRTRLYIQKTKDDPSKKLRLNFAPPRMMKKKCCYQLPSRGHLVSHVTRKNIGFVGFEIF